MDSAKRLSLTTFFIFFIAVVNSEENETLGAIWNLTEYAIQSRQIFPGHPSTNIPYGQHHINRFQAINNINNNPIYAGHYNKFHPYPYHPNSIHNYNQNPSQFFATYQPQLQQNPTGYGPFSPPLDYPRPQLSQNPTGYGPFGPHFGYPRPHLDQPQHNKGYLSSFLPSRESLMEALDSIARNDELHCVPRILCEVTSGTLSARQSGLKLPFNINMDSIVGILSGFNGMELNPLFSFGKAALLGYSSKGNAGTCMYAYPECPRDPEKLVEYLNNYNGGFFRFFNGIHPQYQQNQPPYLFHRPQYPINFHPGLYNNYKNAEKRILTRPDFGDALQGVRQQKEVKFPNNLREVNNELYQTENFQNSWPSRTLRFPMRNEDANERPLRQPKGLTVFQRPTPDHRPTPMIFPDRTGTGELKFSLEELEENLRGPSAFQNNNFVSFGTEENNDPFYSWSFEADSSRPHYHGMNELNNHFFPA
ncbi:uncharacterized protein LOC123686238 [Harmonia axyridis]|uniref:uncharacterized protein LOC123686238 n=1 Tax=Harmonia axyridis TaxID=115357 RepID=UPI001E279410|nr:uncharacterized protein LOC123686238 [Harmonia axyridis]